MITDILNTLAANPPKETEALINLLESTLSDDSYRKLVDEALSGTPNHNKHRQLLYDGNFSGIDFLNLLLKSGNANGIGPSIAGIFLRRLINWGLVADNKLIDGIFMRYQWIPERIRKFYLAKILDNIILGPTYVVRKYKKSVIPIFVKKDQDNYTGTGFITSSSFDARNIVVMTAKHNIDPNDGVRFESFGNIEGASYRPKISQWVLHPTLDLVLIPVESDSLLAPIYPLGTAQPLSRTISFGYPRIATADGPYLLVHGGEVNAIVNNYYGQRLIIISNAVSPGNSGGPVLDEGGLCIGMVVKSFETSYEDGVTKTNAAIPSDDILDFINANIFK